MQRGTTNIAIRAARRARASLRPRAEQLRNLAPATRTAQRIPPDRTPPPPSAFARFGDGSWVVPPADVRRPRRIAVGSGVVVMEHSLLQVLDDAGGEEPLLVLGDNVLLARFNTIICGIGVSLGERVASSDSATVFDTWWPGAPFSGLEAGPVVIGRHAYLGCNSIVCPGVEVGEGAYVGEGSVVVDDVPPHSVVYGNPARVVRRYEPGERAWRDGATR